MNPLEFLMKWAPSNNQKVNAELSEDVFAMCDELAARHEKQAVKYERRRVREVIDKMFEECRSERNTNEPTLTKDGLLAFIFPPTPAVPGTAPQKAWEDVTL